MRKAFCDAIKWALNLDAEQRQALTTWSLLGGLIALSVMVGAGVHIIVYELPPEVVKLHAEIIIKGLLNIIYGLLVLMGVKIVTQAAIALGGKIMAKFGGAEISADADDQPPSPK